MEKPVITQGSQPQAGNFNAFADYAEFVANAAAGPNFAEDRANTGGLQWGWTGGVVRDSAGTIVIVAQGTVALPASEEDVYVVVSESGLVSAQTAPPDTTVKPIRHLSTDTATITSNSDVRVGFDFAGSDGGGVTSWNDLEDKPTTVAGSGLADAATTAALEAEQTAREDADTALQDDIDEVADDLSTHTAATAPHSGHLKADGSVPLTANWDTGGFTLNNLPDPVSAQQPATKAYVDAIAAGLKPKALVHAATTGNVNLANPGAATFDNVNLTSGQSLLVHQQTTLTENGIYVFNGSGSALTRRTDFDSDSDIPYGAYTWVQAGSEFGGFGFFAIVPSPFTLDSDPIEFSIFTGGGNSQPTEGQNVGTGTGLIHKLRSGLTHFFRSLIAGSNKVSVTTGDDEIAIDINEANLNLANMGGTLPTSKIAVLSTASLGELLVGVGGNSWGKIARNVTAARKYLYQEGDGSAVTGTGFGTIRVIDLPVAQPSGAGHAGGIIPTPGAIAGTQRALFEDMLWKIPPNSGGWVARSNTTSTVPDEITEEPDPPTTRAFNVGSSAYSFAETQRVRAVNLDDTEQWFEGNILSYVSTTLNVHAKLRHGGPAVNNSNWIIYAVPEPLTLEDVPEHEHEAADISDSTSAGRALLTAADVAAQLALLNAVTPDEVAAAVAAIVDSSPAALDTLNELAAALADDPNFATTMTNALAAKAPLASPALTGTPTAPHPAADDDSNQLATTGWVQDEIAGLGGGGGTFVGVKAYGTSNQSVAHVTDTAIQFNSESGGWDTDGFHDTATNNTRFTVPSGKAGYYQLSARVQWDTGSTGVRRIGFRVNGTTAIGNNTLPMAAGANISMEVNEVYYLNVGDYVELIGLHTNGVALNSVTTAFAPTFKMHRLG